MNQHIVVTNDFAPLTRVLRGIGLALLGICMDLTGGAVLIHEGRSVSFHGIDLIASVFELVALYLLFTKDKSS